VALLLALEASSGGTPRSLAKVASVLSWSGLSPAATKMAEATSVPTPSMAQSSGAVSATRVLSSRSISLTSSSRERARRAKVRSATAADLTSRGEITHLSV